MGLFDKLKRKVKQDKVLKKDDKVEFDKTTKEEVKKQAVKENKNENPGKQAVDSVILSPVVSEKSAGAEALGVYTFQVDARANKYLIKKAITDIYGVVPKKVRVLNLEGKKTGFGARVGRRADWKKAVIQLPAGKTINIHEGV